MGLATALAYRQGTTHCIYDNPCALARYSRSTKRRHWSELTETIAGLKFVVPSSHESNHTACTNPEHKQYLPEVLRSNHPNLKKGMANLEANEEVFAWV